jgi:hypothetical protein
MPINFKNKEIMNVYGVIEINKYLESFIFEAAIADEI